MAEPFQARTGTDGGVLSRVLGGSNRKQAIRVLESRLAEAERLMDVSADDVREVCGEVGVDLEERLRTPCRNLYKRFLEHCLVDCELSEEESEELAHLRDILCLSDADAVHVHDEVARSVYGDAIDDVLRDYKLDEEEERFLTRLRDQLEISDEQAQAIYEKRARRAQHRFLSSTTSGEGAILASRTGRIELKGSSTEGLEPAIRAAIQRVADVLPQLQSARLGEVRTEVREGQIAEWTVVLNGWLGAPGSEEEADS